MAVAKLDVIEQYFSNAGLVGNGYKIHTYAGGTSTPLAAYTSSTGGTAHANPIILDSSGRPPGDGIWLTSSTAYKITISTAADVVIETVDNVVAGGGAAAAGNTFIDVVFFYPGGPPLATELLYAERFARAVNFTANFSGAYGFDPVTNPAASFVITVKKNGSTVGTITIATGGTYTFATSGGAAVSFVAGDYIEFYGPGVADTQIANLGITLAGTAA